nr:MAG TPA: hypothetical protein [Bacteriophage sp.]
MSLLMMGKNTRNSLSFIFKTFQKGNHYVNN